MSQESSYEGEKRGNMKIRRVRRRNHTKPFSAYHLTSVMNITESVGSGVQTAEQQLPRMTMLRIAVHYAINIDELK